MFLKTGLRTILCVGAIEAWCGFSPAKPSPRFFLAPYLKACFWLLLSQPTKVTLRSGRTKTTCTIYQQRNSIKAKFVGASLEAPVVSLCTDRNINAKRRDFVRFLYDCIGQDSRAATSAARTDLDFRC